jgi:diazepam-binding inhibitor (GABA receptor modulating acyl-CoA-binding protein)
MLNNIKLQIQYNKYDKSSLTNLDKNFNTACFYVRYNWTKISSFYILSFYALYKQATIGDCNIKCNIYDYTNYIKKNNWNDLRGMSKIDAKIEYIKLYNIVLCKKNKRIYL